MFTALYWLIEPEKRGKAMNVANEQIVVGTFGSWSRATSVEASSDLASDMSDNEPACWVPHQWQNLEIDRKANSVFDETDDDRRVWAERGTRALKAWLRDND